MMHLNAMPTHVRVANVKREGIDSDGKYVAVCTAHGTISPGFPYVSNLKRMVRIEGPFWCEECTKEEAHA